MTERSEAVTDLARRCALLLQGREMAEVMTVVGMLASYGIEQLFLPEKYEGAIEILVEQIRSQLSLTNVERAPIDKEMN